MLTLSARNIVTRGCWLKFSQNAELLKEMEETGEREFVECAPRDRRFDSQYLEYHFLKRIVSDGA